MDLVRTLGVAIDPTRAEAGGAKASAAFRGVAASAREMETAVKNAGNAIQRASQQAAGGRGAGGGGGGGGGGGVPPVALGAGGMGWMRGGLSALGIAGGAAGGLMAGINLGQTEMQIQRVANALRYASNDAADFARNTEYVRDVSAALGLELQGTSREFARFMAAGKSSNLTGQELRDVFLSVAKASTVLGLSSEETSGTLNALQQMISKGTVQAEELRGQLGERLPGAFSMAAKAMGVTTQQLGKMLEQGQVTAKDLLPKLAKEMEKAFGPAAVDASKSLNSEFNRLKTGWLEFKAAILESGVGDFINGLIKVMRDLLTIMTQVVKGVKDLYGSLPEWAKTVMNPFAGAKIIAGGIGALANNVRSNADPAASARQLLYTSPASSQPRTYEMDRFMVSPSGFDNFRAGVGGGTYEFNEKTQKMENQFSNSMRNMVEAGSRTVDALSNNFGGFFDSIVEDSSNAGRAFSNMMVGIGQDIAKILLRQSIVNPIVGAIGGAFGLTPNVPVTAGVKHTGGIVGMGGMSRLVSPSLFDGAPRFHSGLAPDEFPAILQRGERVIPKNQASGGGGTTIVFSPQITFDGSRGGSQEQNQSLGSEIVRQLEQMVDERIVRAVMPRGILRAT